MRVGLQVKSDDFLHMLTRQDRIADYAQNVAEQLAFRPLFDDKEAKENLKKMAQAVASTVEKNISTLLTYIPFSFSLLSTVNVCERGFIQLVDVETRLIVS